MINRRPIQCDGCAARIVVRTAIGHGNKQTHSFPCPNCGVAITYSLDVDQKSVSLKYDETPSNGHWLDTEEDCIEEVVLDRETLGLRDGPELTDEDGNRPVGIPKRMSPFMETMHRFRNYQSFQRAQAGRFSAIGARDAIGRILVHFENQNWDLFKQEMLKLGQTAIPDDAVGRVIVMRAMLIEHQTLLAAGEHNFALKIFEAFSAAVHTNPPLADGFCSEYKQSNRLRSVWTQVRGFRRQFLESAHFLIPILQEAEWESPPIEQELDDYVVYNKQFETLKALYIDGFELFARLSVPFLAFCGITARGSTDVPTKAGTMSIWDYEALRNANKRHHLKGVDGGDFFATHLDTALRNGLGHNAAHYDASTDQVLVYKQQGASLIESRHSYTWFVHRTMALCSALLEADAIVFHILERTNANIS